MVILQSQPISAHRTRLQAGSPSTLALACQLLWISEERAPWKNAGSAAIAFRAGPGD